jgi:hypothetical protein
VRALSVVGGLALFVAAGITTAQAASASGAAAQAALAPVTPQGALAQGAGCTGGVGEAVTCTLVATATADIAAGGATAHVWSFVGGGTTPVNNPTIVATAGQAVTINLTNSLPTTLSRQFPLSLAVPGLSGLTSDYQGVDAGSSKTYTFTPAQPGTYVYQAGHILRRTAQGGFDGGDVGPREVAMGLAGVLVVRPADFATTATVFGGANQTPANAFDDEAALLLTDVDPAFAAAPDTYDLRKFNGTMRLINGKAYPSTDPIASAPGHKVLLRYANAGVISHSMAVLGQRQSVVGISGHLSTGEGLIADTITAGSTEDAIVAVPTSGGSGRLAVFDASGRLDTNGATSGARRQLVFGGMLTFIQYDAASVTTDTVGPTSTITAVTPGTVTSTGSDVTVTASFTDPPVGAAGLASPISSAEVAVDAFKPSGNITFALTPSGNSATGTATIPGAAFAGLSSGTHTILVRAYDSATPPNVGPTASASIVVNVAGPTVSLASLSPRATNGVATPATDPNGVRVAATGDASATGGMITSMAYAVDGGATVAFPAFTAAPVVAATAILPWSVVNGLAEGDHTVTITATDDAGVTSGTPATGTLTVDRTGPTGASLAVSPNPTNVTVGDGVDPTSIKVSGTFTDSRTNVAAAEGFLQPATAAGAPDTTRTCGAATFPCQPGTGFVFVATDGAFNAASEVGYGTFPLSQLAGYKDGAFTVWVRAKDAAGNWGGLTATTFIVDRTAPTITAATLAQSGASTPTLTVAATDANGATAAEWFEGADPGVGLATPVAIGGAVPVTLAPGQYHTLSVRVRDAAGNWSAIRTTNRLYVDPVFASSFETGNAAGWSAATGGTAAPAYPLVTGFDRLRAMLTAANSNNSNVTTPVLTGAANTAPNPPASTYDARFLFRNQGPNVGTATTILTNTSAAWVNILSLRSGTADVVDVQYRRTAANNGLLRVAVRSGTFGTTYRTSSNSVPLGNDGAVHTVRVGFTAGGAVTLQVDANAVTTMTFATPPVTTNSSIDRAVLGTSTGTAAAGGNGTVTGRAYFDYFEARRNSMP